MEKTTDKTNSLPIGIYADGGGVKTPKPTFVLEVGDMLVSNKKGVENVEIIRVFPETETVYGSVDTRNTISLSVGNWATKDIIEYLKSGKLTLLKVKKTLSLKHKKQNDIANRLSVNTGKKVNLGRKQLEELEEQYNLNDDSVFYELYKENKFRFKIKNKEDDIILDEEITTDEMVNKIKELEEGQRAIFSLHNSIIRESGDLFDDYAYNFQGVLLDNVTLDLVEGFEINVYANSIEEGEKKAEKIINENPEWKDKVIIEFNHNSKDEGSGQSIEVEDEIIQSIISGIRSDIRDYSTRNYSKLPIGVYADGGGVDDQISSIIQKLKDEGYSNRDNVELTVTFNGKEIELDFYYKTEGDWELEIFAPLTIIEILSKYLTFDKVSQDYTSINVDLLFYYKGNRVCTMMGSWDEDKGEMTSFIKIGAIESSYFNSYPTGGFGDFDKTQFEKNIKNAINEINSKKTLSLKHKKQNDIAKRLSVNTGKQVNLGEKQLEELEEQYDIDEGGVFYELYKENKFLLQVENEKGDFVLEPTEMTIDEIINQIRELKEDERAVFSAHDNIDFSEAFTWKDDKYYFNYPDVLEAVISGIRSDIRDYSHELPNTKYKDGGEIWKLTKDEYAKETITVHSGDNLKRKKTDLERYFEENITNVFHAHAVKKAIQEGKYEEAIKNGTMTRERANEIMKLANGGQIGEFDIKSILEKTSLSQGTKDILENDFVESGYSNIFSLIAETPEKLPIKLKIWATSKNIQEKINGFKGGKNTYLQANMIAEVMHSIDISEIPKVPTTEVAAEVPTEEVPTEVPTEVVPTEVPTEVVTTEVSREEKKKEIEDLIEVLQPIADDGNSEAEELISTLKDVLESESYKNGGSIFGKSKSQKDKGKRVRLIEMKDTYPVPEGTMGTIDHIDDAGQIHVKWDNGSSLALIPNLDEYEIMAYGGQLKGGKSDNLTLSQIAKRHNVDLSVIERQYALGMEIESEHTNDKNIQAEIVKDHLTEFHNYYTELIKMETYLDKQKEYAEEGILVDNEDGFYIDLDDSIDHEMFFVMLMMDGIKYVEIPTNNSKRRIEFNTERDFDRALAGINKISNKAKQERSNFDYPKNLNQLKKILNKGFQLKIKYHRARPTEVGNIREVAVIQNNAVAYKDLSKPNTDLIWFYYPKANEIDFQENGFTVYFANEPTKKMITYEYYFPEKETPPTPTPTPTPTEPKKSPNDIEYYLSSQQEMFLKDDKGFNKKQISDFLYVSKNSDKKYWIKGSDGFSYFAYKGQLRANDSTSGIFKATKIGVDRLKDDLLYKIKQEELYDYEKEQEQDETIKRYGWELIVDKFDDIYYLEGSKGSAYKSKELSSSQVKASEYLWQFDRYSTYPSTLSWEDAEEKFKKSLTKDELDIIEISYKKDEYGDLEEHDTEKYYKQIFVKNKPNEVTATEVTAIENSIDAKKKEEIEDLIDVLQPIADEGNQEALELIETLQDVLDKLYDDELDELDNEFKMGGESDKYKNAYDYKKGQIIKINIDELEKEQHKNFLIQYKALPKDIRNNDFYTKHFDKIKKDSEIFILKLKSENPKITKIVDNNWINIIFSDGTENGIEAKFIINEYKMGGKITKNKVIKL
jgi:hypothetical protein